MDERCIIGFDPGLAASGYGIIAVSGSKARHISHGVINTSSNDPEEIRIMSLYRSMADVLAEQRPVLAGIESIFFAKNVRSAIPVAQARGVILLACAQAGVRVHSFSPPQIKQYITGVGRAQKGQIQEMIRLIFGLRSPPGKRPCRRCPRRRLLCLAGGKAL